jgi:hypothetical protein
VSRRAYSVAAVINVLRNEPRRPVLRLDLSARDELAGVGDGRRALSIYDQLATRGACAAEREACAPAAEGMVLS